MKRFKYLYFTNVLDKPYFNFWFLKKLKGGEEDDGNLLTQPIDHEEGGVKWVWNGMTATSSGVASTAALVMTDTLPLKETIKQGESYTFSIGKAITKNIRLYLVNDDGNKISNMISSGSTERVFQVQFDATKYYLQYAGVKNVENNVTIEDIKLVKES